MRPFHAAFMLVLALAGCASSSHDNTPSPPSQATRIPAADIPSPALLAGMYSYLADAATFTLCSSGTRYPVAFEADHAALERAYLAVRHEPGVAVLVTVQGRFEKRPSMEGAPREHFIVDRFDAIWPDETCEKSGVGTPLRNTYWRLVELNKRPVRPHENQREVHILLRGDETAVRGFAGCNAFVGGFVVDGTNLTFEKLAVTMSACPWLDEETEFVAVLEKVTGYRILGETLILLEDADVRARFRAVYF